MGGRNDMKVRTNEKTGVLSAVRTTQMSEGAFTLVELMIVVAIIGLLAAIAMPALASSRRRSQTAVCRNNQRIIYQGVCQYCMDYCFGVSPSEWPNLCAARNRLSPGGGAMYVKNWKVFECPVADSQDQHDYAYVFTNGEMTGVRCNNTAAAIRNLHNE